GITNFRRKALSLVTAGTLLLSSAAMTTPVSAAVPQTTQAAELLINQQFGHKFIWDSVKSSTTDGKTIIIGHSGGAAGLSITINCTITLDPFSIQCTIIISSSKA